MNLDDFRCMRRGIHLAVLNPEEANLVKPLQISNGKKNSVLLLLHGYSSTPAVFRELIPSLVGYDMILCPALPAHGKSIEAFATMKASDLLEYVKNLTASLINDFDNVDILGLSLGGLLACYLGSQFKIRHLYLLAPALDLNLNIPFNLKLAQFLKRVGFTKLRSAAGNLYSQKACEIAYRQLPITSIIELFGLIQNFEFIAPTCPTDLFLGRHDEVVNCEAIAARFANNPNTTIHWLDNSAHVLPLDGDIEAIIQSIREHYS